MKQPVYLGLQTLELSKTLIFKFQRGYVKPKYRETKLIQIVQMKAGDSYKDIEKDIEKRFDTSNYDLERPLPRGKS